MPRAAITLRVFVGGSRWRLSEHDRIEVWRGMEQIGTLTGGSLTFLVEHLLLTADMVSWVRGTPTPLAARPPTPALPPARKPLEKAPPKGVPFTNQERTTNAARRRARRKA
jgi:hypothetical protein